ncbi:MAG: HAMP domain-containing sensor histidine kinase [Bdellovibrionota bacterium]|nr:HAMP domain-containing sensor histidine kinase [Bdellovibrionota bacterium]
MNGQLLSKYKDKTKRTKYYTYIAALFTFTIVFLNFYFFKSIQQQNEQEVLNKVLINEFRNMITYYDEVLTMSARTAAATGDLKWETRYNEFVPKLDNAINRLNKLIPVDIQEKSTMKTSEANDALISMEMKSFDLVRNGQQAQAQSLLFSDDYDQQKEIYSAGMSELNSDIDSFVTTKFKELRTAQDYRNIFVFLSLIIIFITWGGLINRNYKERSRIESELQHISKLASIGELSASIGHEINNPLTIADGNLQRLVKRLKELNIQDEKVFSLAQKQTTALNRIQNITEGMRNYSRKERDLKTEFDPSVGALQMVDMVEYSFSQLGIKFDFNLTETSYKVNGNESVFQQVIMNLLSNARDAMEDSTQKQIHISSYRESTNLVIEISDTGSGMPEEVRKKIFEPFYTTKEVGKGTGLGMSLVYSFISDMNGGISIDSEVGKGTSFKISLPISLDS